MRKSLGTARTAALEFISDLSKTSLKAARTSPLRAAKDCEGDKEKNVKADIKYLRIRYW